MAENNVEQGVEQGPERIHTKEEVLSVISAHIEGARSIEVVKELSDEKGLYLLEARVEVESEHDETHYEYMRKGSYPDGNATAETIIHVVFYQDGDAIGGHNVVEYHDETGQWETIE